MMTLYLLDPLNWLRGVMGNGRESEENSRNSPERRVRPDEWIRAGFRRRDGEANSIINDWISGRVQKIVWMGGRDDGEFFFDSVQHFAPVGDKPVEIGNRLKYVLLDVVDLIHERWREVEPFDQRRDRLASVKYAIESLQQPLFANESDFPGSRAEAVTASLARVRKLYLTGELSGIGDEQSDRMFKELRLDIADGIISGDFSPRGTDSEFENKKRQANLLSLGRAYVEYTVLTLANDWANTHSLSSLKDRELLLEYLTSCAMSSKLAIPASYQSR